MLFSPADEGEQDDQRSMVSAKAIQYKYRSMNRKRRGGVSSPSSRKGTKFAFLVKENYRKYQRSVEVEFYLLNCCADCEKREECF